MTAYQLQQRGRASIDFLTDLRGCSNRLEADPAVAGINPGAIFDYPQPGTNLDFVSMQAKAVRQLSDSQAFRVLRLCREWMLAAHGRIAMDAFAEMPVALSSALDAAKSGGSTLQHAPDLILPAYWEGYEFHRSMGGWDGHDYMGFVHGELIHFHMVGRALAGVLHAQRMAAAAAALCDSPERILEMGCASGQFTAALAETYPDACITALDLSPRQLEQTQRRGNEQGASWSLLQAAAEQTGLQSAQYDLVCSYAVFHELPRAAAEQVMAEKFRLCKVGGVLLMADVKPYSSLSAHEVWSADFWNQVVGGDPYWREYAMTDFIAMAKSSGFVDVVWQGLGQSHYPYVLTGRKPAPH
ncbi:MAG: class I SAM-dependent methyltransferase [Gammaproteobacteria bacterium]|nr:class I SAM-dependent methyltransferase [Gammaproteobacteria bacterium]